MKRSRNKLLYVERNCSKELISTETLNLIKSGIALAQTFKKIGATIKSRFTSSLAPTSLQLATEHLHTAEMHRICTILSVAFAWCKRAKAHQLPHRCAEAPPPRNHYETRERACKKSLYPLLYGQSLILHLIYDKCLSA